MTDLSNNELRKLDLTLLLVFLGLMRHRKASAVAQELGLTQSAISQALRRLRDIFRDELFLRRPHGMEPTAAALALELPVSKVVTSLRSALRTVHAFEPETAAGVVRIAALDAEQAVLLPRLAARIAELAPRLKISVAPLGRQSAIEALVEGRVDLALGFLWDTPEALVGQKLYEETFLVAGMPDILPQAPHLSLEDYCAAKHVLVSPGGDMQGIVDGLLAGRGLSRHILLGLPSFLPALAAVRDARAIVTLPGRIARQFAPAFGLVLAEPPLEVRRFPVSVFWHRRNDRDPLTRWLIGLCAA